MTLTVLRNPFKETLSPAPDNVTVVFNTSQAYRPGSSSVWLNGIKIISEWDDGYTETGDREITMKEPPMVGDSVQVEYDPQ